MTPFGTRSSLLIKIATACLLVLVAMWVRLFVLIDNNYSDAINRAEQRVLSKSQIFAEYTLATIKRVDQISREARSDWEDDPAHFERFVSQQSRFGSDFAIQIAVIAKTGILVYSSLGPVTDRLDLSKRESFRVHRDAGGVDRLFVGRPVIGEFSGKWSIQFTRPINNGTQFDGVLVTSVRPEQFGAFAKDLELGTDGIASLIRDAGERLAHFPINDQLYGLILPNTLPFLAPAAPRSGTFRSALAPDAVDRIYGFTRLPEYGVTALIGETTSQNMAGHDWYRKAALSIGVLLTAIAVAIAYFQFRRISERRRQEKSTQIAASVYSNSSEAMMLTDSDNAIISINEAFTGLTGYRSEEVLGRSPRILHTDTQDSDFWREFREELNATGRWRGELENRRKDGTIGIDAVRIDTVQFQYGSNPIRITAFRDVTAEKASQERVWKLANYDALTGLTNRPAFRDALDHEIRRADRTGAIFALLFLDIDHFKNINDTLGHSVGDALLIEVSSRLRKSLRKVDTIARMGGDEFTLILSELAHIHDAEPICQKLLTELELPIQIGDSAHYVTASVGITIYPDDGGNAETLLKGADQAMYASKKRGRNCYTFFSNSMQDEASAKAQLTHDLHIALRENQFQVCYQPIIDISTGRVCKAEALIRWQHPELGILPPSAFIPYATEAGLIKQIDQWVLEQVATMLRSWPQTLRQDFQISVNKSALDFRTEDDALRVIETCQDLFSNLVLEITERLLLDDAVTTVTNLRKLHDAGIAIALDDFGTGFSSLSYIARFPVTYLKIDQTFVSEVVRPGAKEAALCKSIVVLAHELGIKVIAEGVETREQCDWLASVGCDYVQGYLYYAPMKADAFEEMVIASIRA